MLKIEMWCKTGVGFICNVATRLYIERECIFAQTETSDWDSEMGGADLEVSVINNITVQYSVL